MKKAILLLLVILIFSCTGEKTRNLVSQVYETEEDSELNRDERVKELTSDIKKIEKDLDDTLEKYTKLGNFHRALGIKMIHHKMFYKAYEHFTKALEFYPNSEMLHYYRGISASQYALSLDDEVKRREYLNRALYSQEYSVKLNPKFIKGLYALSILYIYEFDRAEEAKPLLDMILKVSSREFDSMLLRALLYEKDGEYNAALDLYDKVLSLSENPKHLVGAEQNRSDLLKKMTNE